ncbi:MAG TPA: hypothetical protein DCE44_02530, partial [Verrucomicrobiales bacterium]|nr:hypothetical protein [Verrucomicrobiales bacterium]
MNPDPSAASELPPAGTACRPSLWRGFGRHCWRGFRWSVRVGYALAALAIYAVFHLHYIGVPGFLKEPLLAQLSAFGVDLDYSRLRLRIPRGLVAENVTLRIPGSDPDDFTYVQNLGIELDWSPLWQLREPQVSGMSLSGGESSKAVEGAPGEASALLKFTEISGRLEFVSRQEWRLTSLKARLNEIVDLEALGVVTNVAHLSSPRRRSADLDLKVPALARVLEHVERMEFREPPRIDLVFMVDGANLIRSVAQLRFGTAGVRGPNGDFQKVRLAVEIQPTSEIGAGSRGIVDLDSDAAQTRWGSLESLHWRAEVMFPSFSELPAALQWQLDAKSLAREEGRLAEIHLGATTVATNNPSVANRSGARNWSRITVPPAPGYATEFELEAADLSSRWGSATNLAVSGSLWNSANRWSPLAADWELRSGPARIALGQADSLVLRGSAVEVPPIQRPRLTAFWTNLAPWQLQLEALANRVVARSGPPVDRLEVEADWRQGRLTLTNLVFRSPAGTMEGQVLLDTATRDLTVNLQGTTEVQRLEPYLFAEHWRQLTNVGVWTTNRVDLEVAARGQWPRWESDVAQWIPRLQELGNVHGALVATNFALAHLNLKDLRVPFELSKDQLRLNSLRWTQGAGELVADVQLALPPGAFHLKANSSIDPLDFRRLLDESELTRHLDFISFASPPHFQVEAWGHWDRSPELGFDAKIALTNVTYRGEPVTELRTALSFTNRNIVFVGTELREGPYGARVPLMRYDLDSHLLHLTNAQARLPVDSLGRIIGPKIARTLSPYQFPFPPEVRATGSIPTTDDADANVVFQVQAPALEWWYFRLTNVLATIGWFEDNLTITNVAAGFYDGLMSAKVGVRLNSLTPSAEPKDTRFSVDATFAEVNITPLMADLTSSTNRLEGVLSGQVIIDEGHSRSGIPWRGNGNAQIRDGLLWGLPLFGVLSPMFNAVAPGSGEARFNAGNAFFVLTNNVVDFSRVELL